MTYVTRALICAEHAFYMETVDKTVLDRVYGKRGLTMQRLLFTVDTLMLKNMNDEIRASLRRGE